MAASLALFSRRVHRVNELTDGGRVPVTNSSQATFCVDAAGRQWVRKKAEDTGFNEIIAESVAALLAQSLNLPVPASAVAEIGTQPAWLSERVPNVVHWSEGHGHFVTNGDGLGGVLALDAVLMNPDRHAGNILLQPQDDEFHLKAWGIDFGDSLVGWPDDFAACPHDALPAIRNLARGIPVELVSDGARTTAAALSNLSATVVGEIVAEACELARESAVQVLAKALAARCARATSLAERYLLEIAQL